MNSRPNCTMFIRGSLPLQNLCAVESTRCMHRIYYNIFSLFSKTRVIAHAHIHARAFPHSTSEKSPVPTLLSTVQLDMPNKNFVAATVTLVAVTFCFHNFASYFILNETFGTLQQHETLYFGCTNLGSHAQLKTITRNCSCRQRRTCELPLLREFLSGMDCLYEFVRHFPVLYLH